jgi:hypothetical protein
MFRTVLLKTRTEQLVTAVSLLTTNQQMTANENGSLLPNDLSLLEVLLHYLKFFFIKNTRRPDRSDWHQLGGACPQGSLNQKRYD